MTLTIKLTPSQEAKLEAIARETGTNPQELVKRLVEDDLSQTGMTAAQSTLTTANDIVDRRTLEGTAEFRQTLNAIPEGRRPEFIQDLLQSAQSGSYDQLLDSIMRWAEIGGSLSVHPFSHYAGTFAGDAIFAEVKQTIAANRRERKIIRR